MDATRPLESAEGRLDVLNRETFPWSPEASTMACQTIRGLIAENAKLAADNEYFRDSPNLAFYAQALRDRDALAAIEARLRSGKSFETASDIEKILEARNVK